MRNENYENVLLAFWLPLRKSNFINHIGETGQDNLINRIINFAFDYHLEVKKFRIVLNEWEYETIFKINETKQPRVQRKYIKQSLVRDKENIQLTGDIRRQSLRENTYNLSKRYTTEVLNINFSKNDINNSNELNLRFKFTDESIKIFDKFKFFEDDREKFKPILLKNLEFRLLIDEYGFYFINVEIYKSTFFKIDYKLIQLFVKTFFSWDTNSFNLLTVDQRNIIKNILLFKCDIYDMDDEIDIRRNFFKKVITHR